MDDIICFVDKWKDFTEFIYFLVVIVGVVIAYIQLRANTKAQQALRSPELYIYCPEGGDPINALLIKNEGDVMAIKVTIYVTEKVSLFYRIWKRLTNKKVPSSIKKLDLLKKSDEKKSIYENESVATNFSNVKVKITYYSPFHNTKMKKVNFFNRD